MLVVETILILITISWLHKSTRLCLFQDGRPVATAPADPSSHRWKVILLRKIGPQKKQAIRYWLYLSNNRVNVFIDRDLDQDYTSGWQSLLPESCPREKGETDNSASNIVSAVSLTFKYFPLRKVGNNVRKLVGLVLYLWGERRCTAPVENFLSSPNSQLSVSSWEILPN